MVPGIFISTLSDFLFLPLIFSSKSKEDKWQNGSPIWMGDANWRKLQGHVPTSRFSMFGGIPGSPFLLSINDARIGLTLYQQSGGKPDGSRHPLPEEAVSETEDPLAHTADSTRNETIDGRIGHRLYGRYPAALSLSEPVLLFCLINPYDLSAESVGKPSLQVHGMPFGFRVDQ